MEVAHADWVCRFLMGRKYFNLFPILIFKMNLVRDRTNIPIHGKMKHRPYEGPLAIVRILVLHSTDLRLNSLMVLPVSTFLMKTIILICLIMALPGTCRLPFREETKKEICVWRIPIMSMTE